MQFLIGTRVVVEKAIIMAVFIVDEFRTALSPADFREWYAQYYGNIMHALSLVAISVATFSRKTIAFDQTAAKSTPRCGATSASSSHWLGQC